MDTTCARTLAAPAAGGPAFIVVCGLLVTAVLVWSVWFGIRVRRAESPPPRPEEQPTPPESGPVRWESQYREPNEVPRATGPHDRLTPHQLGNSPDRPRRRNGDDGTDPPPRA
ncbi:DUF6479 family protein [Streptomyces sp. S6]